MECPVRTTYMAWNASGSPCRKVKLSLSIFISHIKALYKHNLFHYVHISLGQISQYF